MTEDLMRDVKAARAAAPSTADRVDALRGVEGIRDPVPLEQMCPRCRNRGFIQYRGESTPCSCSTGRQIVYRDVAINTLTAIHGSQREAVRWLEDVHQRFRDRPIHLLRDDRASQVFEEIRREAEVAGVPPPRLPVFSEPRQAPTAVEGLRDTARQRTLAELRKVGRVEAAQLIEEHRESELKDNDRAFLDALTLGIGYLVDGKHVPAERIQVFRYGRHPGSPNPGPH